MSFFRELFSRALTARDLKQKLNEVERERRRAMHEMKKLSSRQADLLERIKNARKNGNTLEFDYLYEDLKAIQVEAKIIKKEAHIYNLEGISLKRYIRGLERLERIGDKESAKKLIERVRTSGLDAKLASLEIDDRAYLDELQATLDHAGLDADLFEDLDHDPDKLKFLAQIDEINAAEEAGDVNAALEKEAKLRAELEEGEQATH